MDIEIKNRFTGKVILCGKYESTKDALEKNRTADLSRADLSGADLSGADLSRADLSGADLYGADLYGADLSGADLSRADLSGADLYGANLYGADLSGADLSRAKQYVESHDFFAEIIKRQKVEDFTPAEWVMIGVILVHLICWDSIKKRYGKKIMPVFKKLAKCGFGEWEEKYKEMVE